MRSRRGLAPAFLLLMVVVLAVACSDDGGALDADGTSTTSAATPDATTTGAPTTEAPDEPTTTTAFVPPLPETTPNVSQPPDSLLDGTHVAFLVEVDVPARRVVFDLVQWFYRDDFEQAIADGRLGSDDPCVELDYCIVNTNQATRTMDVTADARVSIVDYEDCCEFVRTDDLADAATRLAEGRDLFLITASDGEIEALDEVYLS
jgi:hypothetical protein